VGGSANLIFVGEISAKRKLKKEISNSSGFRRFQSPKVRKIIVKR